MILIDTGPLVALCDPRDSLNKMALKHLKTLAKAQLATCEPVISEACLHLPAPSQRMRLRQTLERLDVVPAPVDDVQLLWKEIFEWLNKYSLHEPDWADGYLAVLCSRDRKLRVWTYDVEFRSIWRRVDGTQIPLAIQLPLG